MVDPTVALFVGMLSGWGLCYISLKGVPTIHITRRVAPLTPAQTVATMAAQQQGMIPLPLDPPPAERDRPHRTPGPTYAGLDNATAEDIRKADLWDQLNANLTDGVDDGFPAFLRA